MTVGQILLELCVTQHFGTDGRKDGQGGNLGCIKNFKNITFSRRIFCIININKRKCFRPKHYFYINNIVIEIALLKYSEFFLQFYDNGPYDSL